MITAIAARIPPAIVATPGISPRKRKLPVSALAGTRKIKELAFPGPSLCEASKKMVVPKVVETTER